MHCSVEFLLIIIVILILNGRRCGQKVSHYVERVFLHKCSVVSEVFEANLKTTLIKIL